MSVAPSVLRVRHELRRRILTVARVERVAPKLTRIVLQGDELRGFTSLGFDDHVKVFFPTQGEPAMRDFTPRRFDAQAGELWIDFYLHEAGPATSWAAQAAAGQSLEIGGPKGSAIISTDDIESHVFIGDETAVPAISRRLEELPPGTPTLSVIEIEPGETWPALPGSTALDTLWVSRGGHDAGAGLALIEALRDMRLPSGRCFYWIAVESSAARAIRRYLCDERGIDKHWIKAAGYWRRNAPGRHERIDD
jgi:NADPH-dependent ferric siderophore reductase